MILLMFFGCQNKPRQVSAAQVQPIDTRVQETLLVPGDTLNTVFNGLEHKSSVLKYYQTNSGQPVWVRNGNHTSLADSMMYVVRHVHYYGFSRGSYHLRELESIESNFLRSRLIRREVLLTDAFFSLSEDLKYGLINPASGLADSLQISLLNAALFTGNITATLASVEPVAEGYTSLRRGLRLMLDSAKTWPVDSMLLQENIRLISINLERWRAESENISSRYLFINIPSFNLDVVENDSVVMSSKVIVGTPEKQTPVLSSVVECISIYPYWHVPRKISVEEYLPVIQKDSSFISRNNFEVLDRKGNILSPDSVPWNKFNQNYFPVTLRQREGPENSLGVIKFVFDNPHAVFLHDTNAKRLFKSKVRAFSHGCIRMEKAIELAHFLVTGVVGMESKYVKKYLKEKSQHWVELKRPIPIHIRYFTCEFKNNIFFRYNDIYGKDEELYRFMLRKDRALDL